MLAMAAARPVGGVYFIRGVDGGPIKIGRSVDICERLRDLQTGSPVPLRIVAFAEAELGESTTLERVLHNRFAWCRSHGEWFNVELDEVQRALEDVVKAGWRATPVFVGGKES